MFSSKPTYNKAGITVGVQGYRSIKGNKLCHELSIFVKKIYIL